MIKKFITIFASCAATITLSAQNFNYNFDATDSDAWQNGSLLNSGAAILAQAPWVITTVDSNLYASNASGFNRAVFFTSNDDTFDVGETITLELSYKFADASQINTGTTMFRFGFKDTYANGTAAIGMDIDATPADIRIKGIGESNVTVGATQDGLFHTYTAAITKTAVANTFDLSISFDNVEAASYTVVNSALYGATRLFPVLDTQSGGGKGGALVDSFSRTVVPESSVFAATFGILALACVVARRKPLA
mgnify:CR=1 FL=1|jgi:hypothetical protein